MYKIQSKKAIKTGKKMVSFYLNKLKDIYAKNHNDLNKEAVMLYSEYKLIWEESHPEFAKKLDDSFYAKLSISSPS